jgi:hypothetical protein
MENQLGALGLVTNAITLCYLGLLESVRQPG